MSLNPDEAAVVRLSYDEKTGCWVDIDGQAWTVSATAEIVDLVRVLPDERSKCPLCRRRFGTKKQPDFHARKLHLLNDHSSWSAKNQYEIPDVGGIDPCAVERWIHQGQHVPDDDVFVHNVKGLMDDWFHWRSRGMDAVASSCRDRLAEIIESMKRIQ